MSVWPTFALGELFEIARGGSPRPIDNYITDKPEGINWISIADATNSSKFILETKRRIKPSGAARSRAVKPGDFLLTNSMSFGRPYIMGTTGCIHDGWLVLRPLQTSISQDYFYQLLSSDTIYREFSRLASGATVKNLNIDLVRGVKVRLPPLSEQHRIAAILDQADALRTKRRAALAQLDKMAQAIFVEMFVSAKEGASWPRTRIGEVACSVRTGPFGSQLLHSEFVESGIAVLGIDNAVLNEFTWKERRFITEKKYEQMKRYRVYPNDIIITIMGTCGRAAIVPDDVPLAITTKHLCSITLDDEHCLPEYLHACFLRHPFVLKQLGSSAKGAVMPGLNMGLIKETQIPLPPLLLQKSFAERMKQLKILGKSKEAACNKLDALFASLQHRAFAGEL